MLTMKTDMAGGAAVIGGAARALPRLGAADARSPAWSARPRTCRRAAAQRPGDVLTQYGGRTVEVLNTDAEGRLVLADALAFADATLDPDVIVDIATLTGAAALALGKRHGAMFANRDGLAAGAVRRRRRRPASGCGGCRWSRTTARPSSHRRRPAQHRRPRAAPLRRRHHGGAVPARVRGRPPVGPPRHRRARPAPTRTRTSSPRAAPASPSVPCSGGWSPAPAPELGSLR